MSLSGVKCLCCNAGVVVSTNVFKCSVVLFWATFMHLTVEVNCSSLPLFACVFCRLWQVYIRIAVSAKLLIDRPTLFRVDRWSSATYFFTVIPRVYPAQPVWIGPEMTRLTRAFIRWSPAMAGHTFTYQVSLQLAVTHDHCMSCCKHVAALQDGGGWFLVL